MDDGRGTFKQTIDFRNMRRLGDEFPAVKVNDGRRKRKAKHQELSTVHGSPIAYAEAYRFKSSPLGSLFSTRKERIHYMI